MLCIGAEVRAIDVLMYRLFLAVVYVVALYFLVSHTASTQFLPDRAGIHLPFLRLEKEKGNAIDCGILCHVHRDVATIKRHVF